VPDPKLLTVGALNRGNALPPCPFVRHFGCLLQKSPGRFKEECGKLLRDSRPVRSRVPFDFARQSTGSSNRIARAMVMCDAPSMAAGEMTDKGSINQAAVLKRRSQAVEQLDSFPVPEGVIERRRP
jgi:hypothetical protein